MSAAGLKGTTPSRKAASISGLPSVSKWSIPPLSQAQPGSTNLPVRLVSLVEDAQGSQLGSQEQQAVGSAKRIDETFSAADQAEPASAMRGSSIASVGSTMSAIDVETELEVTGGNSAASPALPAAGTSAMTADRQRRSGSEEEEGDQRGEHHEEGAEGQDEEEQTEAAAEEMEHLHLESPGRFDRACGLKCKK